ncbi:MAG: hypothetical protein J6S57_02980 [Alphaproteobacteria bacterium]|nr:hypothetical protein [Alphaproteobacteria bacterium]
MMTDRDAIAQDWNAVGDDIRVASGIKRHQTLYCGGFFNNFLDGVRTLNPFGSAQYNKNKNR